MKRDASKIQVGEDKAMRRGGVALMAIAALTTGCSLQPVYEPPALRVATAYPTGDAYKAPAAAPGKTTVPAADIGWRDVLTDPRLQRLVEIGLADNRDVRVAALNVAQLQAQYRIQRAALFPHIDAAAGLSASRTPASVHASDKRWCNGRMRPTCRLRGRSTFSAACAA